MPKVSPEVGEAQARLFAHGVRIDELEIRVDDLPQEFVPAGAVRALAPRPRVALGQFAAIPHHGED